MDSPSRFTLAGLKAGLACVLVALADAQEIRLDSMTPAERGKLLGFIAKLSMELDVDQDRFRREFKLPLALIAGAGNREEPLDPQKATRMIRWLVDELREIAKADAERPYHRSH